MTNVRNLPPNPDLQQLKRQAKELLEAFLAGRPDAVAEVNTWYRGAAAKSFALHDAQLVMARAHGFESWPKLKAHIDGVTIQRLVDAVRAGDIGQVRRMLETRPELANMTVTYGDEHRALHFAVYERNPELVRLLMQYGADPRAGIHPHRDATEALTIARERGYDEIAAIIEEEERRREPADVPASDPVQPSEPGPEFAAVARGDAEWLRARHAEGNLLNLIDWSRGGLLTEAARNNRPDILELLLDFGFDPNERVRLADSGTPAFSQAFPLWHCAATGKAEMAELLLKRGADPNAHVDSSGSSVYSAFSHRQWEMVELLRRYGGVVGADTAAIYRRTDIARELLAGEDPEGKVALGLLSFGASGGAPEIVRMALERIAWPRDDPRWFRILAQPLDFWNHIPWLYAGNKEFDRTTYFTCFRLILERCDPNVRGGFGRTVLHETGAMGGHITDEEAAPFVAALLDAGARTDVRDDLLKSTPLGWACRWGREGVVKVLLDRGADRMETGAEPWARPLAWAEKMGHRGIVSLLTMS